MLLKNRNYFRINIIFCMFIIHFPLFSNKYQKSNIHAHDNNINRICIGDALFAFVVNSGKVNG